MAAVEGGEGDTERKTSATEAEASSSHTSPSPLASLHKYVTLPFALHIDPLPSLHYNAVPKPPDQEVSETYEDSLGYEQPHTTSIGNNLRLQPLVIQPPAHDLETVSFLLDNSRAPDAIEPFARLIRLLHRADDDPHFRNLIEFFDARYDLTTGRLVGQDDSLPALERKPTSKLSRIVSRTKSRKPSGMASSGRPSFSLGQSGVALAPTRSDTDSHIPDESVFEGDEEGSLGRRRDEVATDFGLATSPPGEHSRSSPLQGAYPSSVSQNATAPRCAPHMVIDLKSEPGKYRSVSFPVRLDLHNAGRGLCPCPPVPKGGERAAVYPPAQTNGHLKGRRRGTFLSGGTEEGASAAGFSSGLRRIISPESTKSDRSHISSHSGEQSGDVRGDDALNGGTDLQRLQTSDAGTHASGRRSSTQHGSSYEVQAERGQNRARRPSALNRFLGFRKGRRRERSSSSVGAGSSDMGGEIDEEADDGSIPPVPPIPQNIINQVNDNGNSFGPGATSNGSNVGLLTIERHDSLETTFSESMSIRAAQGEGPLAPLAENGQIEPTFTLPDDGDSVLVPLKPWAGSGLLDGGGDGTDFLNALRRAAEVALSLPVKAETPEHHCTGPSAVQDTLSDKAKGKRAARSLDSRRSPRTSGDAAAVGDSKPDLLEDQDLDEDNIFVKARRGATSSEDEPWWPSGSNDPLPIAILSSLAPALGWDGVLQLCYGRGSPAAQAGDLTMLGRAAAQAEGGAGEAAANGEDRPSRTLQDWERLALSLSRWVELYEMTRIRGGLSREIGLDPVIPNTVTSSNHVAERSMTGDNLAPKSLARAQYSLSSGTIPAEVVADATDRSHAYRRRMGIPEGLPATADGVEPGEYRWSRQRLGPASVATVATLASSSLAHYFSTMVRSDFTYRSAWELDYLEALVLRAPVMAERFPPPGTRAVGAAAVHSLFDADNHSRGADGLASKDVIEGRDTQHRQLAAKVLRARFCPNPLAEDGSLDAKAWVQWTRGMREGDVVCPVVSVQAWWAVIAILNGGGGGGDDIASGADAKGDHTDEATARDRGAANVNLQILGKDEDWRDILPEAFDDSAAAAAVSGAVYI